MESVLNGLSAKSAERWATLLAVPGVIFALTAVLSWILHPVGAAEALDPAVLGHHLHQASTRWLSTTPHRLTAAVLVTLVAAASAAVATELSRPIARIWTGRGLGGWGPLERLRHRRGRRLQRRAGPRGFVPDPYLPGRATRIGDHLLLAESRVQAQYGVSLARLWPRLWHICGEEERTPVSLAWSRYSGATVRAAWALGYLALGTALWWPAGVAGLALGLSAWAAARRAAAELSVLVEALTDVKLLALAGAMGVQPAHGRFTVVEGQVIENLLDKGALEPRFESR